MRNTNRQIIIFTILVILLCFFCVLFFTLPSFLKRLNLSTTGNIGDTLGGITAPLIGIISSILLYLALTRQTESNNEQRLKNESDIIFLLLNQLDNEVNNFYYKYKENKVEVRLSGQEGLNEFCNSYRYEYNIEQFQNQKDFSFKSWYEAGQIGLIIDTLNLIEKRIDISNLNSELKNLFQQKLISFYNCRLKTPLTSLTETFKTYPFQQDEYTEKIQRLVERKQPQIRQQ